MLKQASGIVSVSYITQVAGSESLWPLSFKCCYDVHISDRKQIPVLAFSTDCAETLLPLRPDIFQPRVCVFLSTVTMNACSSALSPISVPHVSKSVGIGRGVQGVRPLGPRCICSSVRRPKGWHAPSYDLRHISLDRVKHRVMTNEKELGSGSGIVHLSK